MRFTGWIATFACLSLASVRQAQVVNGTVTGANAKITIAEVHTGITRVAATNESGNHTFPNLERSRPAGNVRGIGEATSIVFNGNHTLGGETECFA